MLKQNKNFFLDALEDDISGGGREEEEAGVVVYKSHSTTAPRHPEVFGKPVYMEEGQGQGMSAIR